MNVTVRLFGTLQQTNPENRHIESIRIDVPEGALISDLFPALGIEDSPDISVIINHKVQERDQRLNNNDQVSLFRSVHGG